MSGRGLRRSGGTEETADPHIPVYGGKDPPAAQHSVQEAFLVGFATRKALSISCHIMSVADLRAPSWSVEQVHLPRPRRLADPPGNSACPARNVRILARTCSHRDVIGRCSGAKAFQDFRAGRSGQREHAALPGVYRQPHARLECGKQTVLGHLIQIARSQRLGNGRAKKEQAGGITPLVKNDTRMRARSSMHNTSNASSCSSGTG